MKLIDYNDVKKESESDYVILEKGQNAIVVITQDGVKVRNTSKTKGTQYTAYEMRVRQEDGEIKKVSAFPRDYLKMCGDAGNPPTLVGTKWRLSHAWDGKTSTYDRVFLGKEVKEEKIGQETPQE